MFKPTWIGVKLQHAHVKICKNLQHKIVNIFLLIIFSSPEPKAHG